MNNRIRVGKGFALLYYISLSRYMREMEDTLNPFMTGIFLLSLVSLCLCSFSIVTVRGNFLALYMQREVESCDYSYKKLMITLVFV
jgi:hypothetical protein